MIGEKLADMLLDFQWYNTVGYKLNPGQVHTPDPSTDNIDQEVMSEYLDVLIKILEAGNEEGNGKKQEERKKI